MSRTVAGVVHRTVAHLEERRPVLLLLAGLNAVTGLLTAVVTIPLSLGADLGPLRIGASEFGGTPPEVPVFLYSPIAAAMAVPLSQAPLSVLTAAWITAGASLLLAGVARETHGWPAIDRVLAAVAVLMWVPVVNELVLCQVTLVLAAAAWGVIRGGGSRISGIPMGIVLATIPKPMLLPFLVWMAFRRPHAFVSTLVTACVLTVAGVALFGPDRYAGWFRSLAHAGAVDRLGNLSLWADGPVPLAMSAAAIALALVLLAILADEDAGLVAAFVAGLLLAPYTLAYGVTILLVALGAALRAHRRATIGLALTSALAIFGAFPAWSFVALATFFWASRRSRAPGDPDHDDDGPSTVAGRRRVRDDAGPQVRSASARLDGRYD
ncbi:MAG: glycosyltransferase family 87 protein [Chloroflexota bacterium]